MHTDSVSRPWEKIACDLFEIDGADYLITVDYFSNFWEVDRLNTTTKSHAVISKLKAHMARYGIPDILVSDNGPQFIIDKFDVFTSE